MEKELTYLGRVLTDPPRPFAAILGGAKISGKIDVIMNLLDKIDLLLIGGGRVFTFLRAQGHSVGGSLIEEDRIELAKKIFDKARSSRVKLILPDDIVVASEISDTAQSKVVAADKIPNGMKGLDIGPATVKRFRIALADAQTILWNGPMGVFEHKPFAEGTFAIARLLADLTDKGATTIVGGGDSAAAVAQAGLEDRLTHISTGGGASLELLEGKNLPGVEALTNLPKVEAV
jgi:phosphoglycerate kinase